MKSNYIKVKPIFTIGILIGILTIGFIGFNYIYLGMNGNPDKITETAKVLKENMEEKYGIVIINNEGGYTNKDGYGAIFTTDSGITFGASKRKNGSVDTYMEEVWRKKGLEKWGYAETYLSHVEKINLNVGYREEAEKDSNKLTRRIEDVKDDLWLTLIIDLQESYKERTAKVIEQDIFNYYQQLQKDGAEGVELIVRHKQSTGSYMIVRDEHGKFPNISNVESVSGTLSH
ncbi:hypothetical protein [Bacillus sp. 165]|uniref:hypothetical protein n=1 Tax=Bacillus sp. 165 TaxID=1529117 RepID=UPI001AD9A2FB|nr:hypothetical protein [Bacillus sp. 165]MBO9130777.1 hypothetical protein [Bacillus sp. 165]